MSGQSKASSKMPPVLKDEVDYNLWKNDIKVWSVFTDLEKKRIGPAIYLSLEGKARDVVRDVDMDLLTSDTGYDEIIKVLDSVFLKDKNTRSYLAFKEFYNFKRTSGMSIVECVAQFEQYYSEMKKYEMSLPDPVQAFMLLNAINISEENEKLARATTAELTYANMKKQIMRIFAESSNSDECTPAVKVEPTDVYYTRQQNYNSYSGNQRGRGNQNMRFSRGGRAGFPRSNARGNQRNYNDRSTEATSENQQQARMKCYICQSSEHFTGRCPRNENRMRCFNCQSTEHLANRCPFRTERNTTNATNQQVNITLLSAKECNDLTSLVSDCIGMALLDSGCTKTVVGRKWLEVYHDMLGEEDARNIVYSSDYSTFRFGDGAQVVSTEAVSIPAVIGAKQIQIKANVVDNNIPLLLSRDSMKKGNTVIDFCNDKAIILGQEVKLYSTKGGHYCLPLSPMVNAMNSMSNVVLNVTAEFVKSSRSEKKKKAIKLHRQFAHPAKERLIKLLKQSKGYKEDQELIELITEVTNECTVCEEFKKPKSRPVVGMPLASQFNDVVCMDLKEYIHNDTWILHFIDAFTRKSNAVLIKTKKDTEIIKQIYSQWIKHYGTPKKFLSDNGGEFANEKYREMNEKMNIDTRKTAAESPFSNGIVERHNLILYECFQKVLKDVKCDPDIALGWAVSAKNSLSNNDGFSSDQLLYGRNINLPSVLVDEPPALESSTKTDIIRENMSAMHRAREAFIESESSERIRRALRHNIRTYSDEIYENGEIVYYRRKNYKGWKGPATVLGKDGQCVVVKHGTVYCRVHPCHLIKKKRPIIDMSNDNNGKETKPAVIDTSDDKRKKETNVKASTIGKKVSQTNIRKPLQFSSNIWDSDIDKISKSQSHESVVNLEDTVIGNHDNRSFDEVEQNDNSSIIDHGSEDISEMNNEIIEGRHENETVDSSEVDEDVRIEVIENEEENYEEDEENYEESTSKRDRSVSELCDQLANSFHDDEIEDVSQQVPQLRMRKENAENEDFDVLSGTDAELPKNKSSIQFLEDNIWKEATVLSRQPKKSGQYKDWLNVHVKGEKEARSIVWREVVAWKKMPNIENVLILSDDEKFDQSVIDAKLKELDNLKEHDVFEEINVKETNCSNPISTRWVVSEKYVDGEQVTKARLVARGFEEDSSKMIKDSPTCTKESLRLVFTVAATQHWPVQSLDISSAFLQGNPIQRDVYVMPPKDVRTEGVIWKLKRFIYGLNDAPRAWYNKVKSEFKKLGAVLSKYDNSLFMWHKDGQLVGILVCHVDDFTFAGTADWDRNVIGEIKRQFKISACYVNSFKYIGLTVEQFDDEISVSQDKYISEIDPIPVSASRKKELHQPLSNDEKMKLKALSGQMLWVTNHTRPDMSFESCVMSNAGKEPTVKKLIEANKAVSKIKSKNLGVKFGEIASLREIDVICHADATHASLPDGSSQGGHIVAIKGKKGLIPISWQSKKLARVTKSPIASEAAAQCDGADASYLISHLLKEIFPKSSVKVSCKTDNASLVNTLSTTKVHEDKRLRVDVSRLKEMISEGEIQLDWVPAEEMLADPLTKRGASSNALVEALRM